MAEKWVMIRVRQETRDRLKDLQDAITEEMEVNPLYAELGRWDAITVDQAIQVLLRMRDKHHERSHKACEKRKQGKAQPEVTTADASK